MHEKWYFTFGCGHLLAGHYICLFGSRDRTRQAIVEQFGRMWSEQYSEEEWFVNDKSQAEKYNYQEIVTQEEIYA